MQHWRPPRWIQGTGPVGGNAQTLWPAVFSRHGAKPAPRLSVRRDRWPTPDGDFIDVDWLAELPAPDAPLLIMFHGLEGSSRSHYAQAFGHWARREGWGFAVPHFRGCSGELNRLPRSYHSGDYVEAGWVLDQFAHAHPHGPRLAVGVSLGGNVLLRWVQEAGHSASQVVRAVAAVSSPLDLAAVGESISQGFNRLMYARMFLTSLKAKALAKLDHHPGLYDADAVRRARGFYEYDNLVTAPLHGFADTDDYWARCSAGPRLGGLVGVPALVLNARNDPFIPAACLPRADQVSSWVTLWQPGQGGHVGFPGGAWPGHVGELPEAVGTWLATHLA
ncbi:MAG: alpha/beta fold hydrolase [Rubrivivax sp.]|nr:MAG: alpha/beta fold hydrolase [Rubrivivax sp.]